MMTEIDVCKKTWTCYDNSDKDVADLVGASARLHTTCTLVLT